MTASAPIIRVLVVDDEPSLLDDYRYILGGAGRSERVTSMAALEADLFGHSMARPLPNVELLTFQQGDEAVAAVAAANREGRPFAVAFIDLRMPPGLHGVETAEKIRANDPDVQIVIVTAYADVHPFEIAAQVPPADRLFFVQKPFNALEIQQFVNALGAKWRAEMILRQVRTAPEHSGERGQAAPGDPESLPVGMAIFDRDDRVVFANEALRALYRDAPLAFERGATYETCLREIGRDALDPQRLIRPQSWIADRLAWHRAPTGPVEHRLKNGTVVAMVERQLPDGRCVAVHADVTEMVDRLDARAAAEQATAVRMAIGDCAELLGASFDSMVAALHSAEPRDDDNARAAFGAGLDAATRMRFHLDSLKEIGQRRRKNAAVVDLGRVIPRAQQELEAVVGKDIAVEIAAGSSIWPTALDSGRLRETLVELATNARAAMPKGGQLKLRVVNVSGLPSAVGVKSRDHVMIAVADNGVGMNPDVLERALRPFFTTGRAQGRTGLGLSAVHSFVLQSFGELEIESRENGGTTVRLALPRWSKGAGDPGDGSAAHGPAS